MCEKQGSYGLMKTKEKKKMKLAAWFSWDGKSDTTQHPM
jgi:hypothetical protein